MSKKDNIVVTMDGTCGSGKSTIAKRLAERLGVIYLDTGAMYRALTWKALDLGADLENALVLEALAAATSIRLEKGTQGTRVFVDDREVTEDIRTPEVTNAVKYLADLPGVRKILVQQQRDIAASCSVVAEGRDTGTVVFPEADFKFFIDASIEVRTNRRYREFQSKGIEITPSQVRQDLEARDRADYSRPVGALKLASDGILIDTGLTDDIETNLELILEKIRGSE